MKGETPGGFVNLSKSTLWHSGGGEVTCSAKF